MTRLSLSPPPLTSPHSPPLILQSVIEESINGIDWRDVDNLANIQIDHRTPASPRPSDTGGNALVDNIWRFAEEFGSMAYRGSDSSRVAAISKLPASENTGRQDNVQVLIRTLQQEDMMLRIPVPGVSTNSSTPPPTTTTTATTMTTEEQYMAFWTANASYIRQFDDARIVAMFASRGYRNLTAQFKAQPVGQQSYAAQLKVRNEGIARLRLYFGQYQGEHCADLAADDAMLAGLARMDGRRGIFWWPETPIYGVFQTSAGYLFGQNQVVGQMAIWQKRRKDIPCGNNLHPTYRSCLALNSQETAPFAPLGQTNEKFFANTSCAAVAKGKFNVMTSVESLFCIDKEAGDELHGSPGNFVASYDMGTYAMPKKTQQCRMSVHKQLPWIDHKTKELSINLILYNGSKETGEREKTNEGEWWFHVVCTALVARRISLSLSLTLSH